MSYNFTQIENKWQKKWETEGTFNAKLEPNKKKWYGLVEFPYPSGQGLHVGHPRSYTALDIIARTHAAIYARKSRGIITPYASAVAPEISPLINIAAIINIIIGAKNIHNNEMTQSFVPPLSFCGKLPSINNSFC